MSFDVSAEAYTRFMGRFSNPLAKRFVDFAEVAPGARALDVGSGPGALTADLVDRLGVAAVSAIDPSAPFVTALRTRFPDLDVRAGVAEELPYPDGSFDAALAQLVVHFMADPVAGLREMARVTRPGGVIAACAWDHAGDGGPLSVFWRAVHELDPEHPGETGLAGVREGHLGELLNSAGLAEISSTSLQVRVGFTSFDEWWDPFTLGVGPAGAYVAALDQAHRDELRTRVSHLLPPEPFEVTAVAWAARAITEK
jgi:SAM-dependent methyltransferase